MTDETNTTESPEVPEVDTDTTASDVPEVDPRETEAREQGWVPQEEWSGPPEKWRDLDSFLEVGERIKRSHKDLRNELKAQERNNKELKEAIDQLIQGQEAIRKAEREKTIKELKEARREAVADGDVVKVEQLDDAIEKEKTKVSETPKKPQMDPVVQDWMRENTWYGPQNPQAQAFANALDQSNAQQGIDVRESLKIVETEVKKRFPELFGPTPAPTPRRAPAVETAGRSRPSKATSLSDLPEAVQQIAKDFDSKGIMPVKRYIELYNKEVGKK